VTEQTRERNILIVASTAHFLTHFTMLIFPSLALAMRGEFGLGFDQVIGLGFWMYLLFGLGALPFGILTDLWGRPRTMLIISLLGVGACAVWASLATGPEGLRWALAGVGLFASIYHPAGLAWISRDVRRRGWALGVNGVYGNLGVVAAPVIAGLLSITIGWRSTYIVLALPAFLAALIGARLGVDAGDVDDEATADKPTSRRGPALNRRRHLLAFALLCMAMMAAGISYRGQTLVLPAWFQMQDVHLPLRVGAWLQSLAAGSHFDSSLMAATLLTSLAYLAGAVGQVVGGRFADRHDLRLVYFGCHFLSLPLLAVLGLLSGAWLLIGAMVYAFFAFGMQPAENSLVAELTPPSLRSTGYGLKFVVVFGVGSLAVKLVGLWERAGGLASVFPRLAATLVVLLVMVIGLWLVTRRVRLRN
jgi:MFS transporter, FSR family, fosmidomycin resistance protein